MKGLTDRQSEVLCFIRQFTDENICPPTVREIAEHFSFSVRAAQDHIAALQKKGVISQSAKRSRSIRILVDTQPAAPELFEVPILGTVAAGRPLLSDENLEGRISLPKPFVEPCNTYFALHVRGNSMINAGILDGDLAIIRQTENADNGDIVVAVVDDAITLKRFFREPNRIRLQPENPAFNPIYCQDARIVGQLSNIIRTY